MKLSKTTKKTLKLIIGIGLVVVAIIPTPDDATIISPLIQVITGSILIIQYIIDKML